MIQLRLFYDKHDEEGDVTGAIDIRCSHLNKEIGLHVKYTPTQ